jgi:hypothetical protein
MVQVDYSDSEISQKVSANIDLVIPAEIFVLKCEEKRMSALF